MTPAMLKDSEEHGTSVGEIPDLDPIAGYWASMWTTLRRSTPGDQPVSLPALALLVNDEDEFGRALPLIQGMDQVLFDWQRKQREEERKRSQREAKRKQRAKGRR